ncbi:tyrosine-type recombinase/integrase [Amycolatopsis thermophila]|uniref:tyrosine-type recombinase/integrase n=1 Tax=Amycolatopsis thermophila TaxID=206084 RepID=UPI0035209159
MPGPPAEAERQAVRFPAAARSRAALDRRARVAAKRGVKPEELTGWVFPNSKGGLREASNLRRDWRAFRERHKIGDWFTPRTFRRTVATLVTEALPAREASDMLGHSRVSQTTDTTSGAWLRPGSRPKCSACSVGRKTAAKRHQDQQANRHNRSDQAKEWGAWGSNPEPTD